jgi:hypothetical protein
MLKIVVVWEIFDCDLTCGPLVGEAGVCDVAEHPGMVVKVERIDFHPEVKGQDVSGCAGGLLLMLT